MTPENIPAVQIEQAQKEAAPVIKSEENQANWKAFREQRETERKAREASDKMAQQKAEEAAALRAALEAMTNKPAAQEREAGEETEDARINRRVDEILAEKEKLYEAQRQRREQEEYPEKLKQVYSDFNKVCSAENLDYLEYHHPEISAPFRHMPDGFEKWSAVYKVVKKLVPNMDSHKDAAKVDRNLNKPASLTTPGALQGTNAMPAAPHLTEERKAANWERMERSRKGLS